MSTRVIPIALLAIGSMFSYAQNITIDLTFTAINNTKYIQLDSINVMNRTQDSQTMIYWPDTTLPVQITPGDTMLYVGYSTGFPVGVHERYPSNGKFHVFESNSNPITDQGLIDMYIPDDGKVSILVTDIHGRLILSTDRRLGKGNHSFRFSPEGHNLYFLTVRWQWISRTIKILATGSTARDKSSLEYRGSDVAKNMLKASSFPGGLVMQESGILDSPVTNESYTFQFAKNIPCPGTPTIIYEGQLYNTIQIFSQCWLKENLNAGTMIHGNLTQTNNGILEKYCYNNSADSCNKYGGLYQWDEIMQYTTLQGTKGICPLTWHIPTDEEWKILEGVADSQHGIGDQIWDEDFFRGIDAGMNVKTKSGWEADGHGTDLYGFSGLPGGFSDQNGFFVHIGSFSFWWTSSVYNDIYAWSRELQSTSSGVARFTGYRGFGQSVRCLRDY